MGLFDSFILEVDKGRSGKKTSISLGSPPYGLPKYNKVVSGLQKQIYTLIGGNSGTGKTAFVDYTYVILPFIEWLSNKKLDKPDFVTIYFSMERSKKFKIAKWMCVLMYLKYGILIDVKTILSQHIDEILSDDVYEKVIKLRTFFDSIEDRLFIIDGVRSPDEIRKMLRKFAENRGDFELLNSIEEKYVPRNEEIVQVVIDHLGKIGKQSGFSKKESIDEVSSIMGEYRDICGYSPTVIQQFNREIADVNRLKEKRFEPRLEDFKESSTSQEDADVVIALFNPYRYNLMNYGDYIIDKFIDAKGNNRFRSIKIIKNSYGVDDVSIGMNFLGECGLFKELPNAKEITGEHYKRAINP